MRAVLDTNVVMSAIFFGGVPFDVLNAWHNGKLNLSYRRRSWRNTGRSLCA